MHLLIQVWQQQRVPAQARRNRGDGQDNRGRKDRDRRQGLGRQGARVGQ